jgi:predicted metal-binding membrane protein
MAFLTHSWRDDGGGAFRMGLEHGLYCVGCCWVMMGLLFLGGVMNLLWIAAITAFVLLEKLSPIGIQGGRFSGFLLIVSGLLVIGLA